MITLTRLTGAAFALNPDLIERIDSTPDTVITLVDSTKYLVREDLHEVVAAVLDFRAEVLATASAFEHAEGGLHRRGRLSAVREAEDPVVPMSPRQA
jgi:flagellar protein FlbD